MVTVTYRQLIPMDADYPGVSSQIEGFTGARQAYGLDTPINVLDILDNVGLSIGLRALTYADASAVCSHIAIAILRGNTDPWFAGDTRLTNFLDAVETYLMTKDAPVTPKLDSCGDPVPGFYGVIPLSQLTDALAAITVSANALDLNAGTVYSYSSWILQPAPFSPARIAYFQEQALAGGYVIDLTSVNTLDPVSVSAQPLPGYVTQNITDALLANPDTYAAESATFDVQGPVDAQTSYSYGLLQRVPINQSDAPPVSYLNTAIQMLVARLTPLLIMITEDVNLLPSIVSATQTYMAQYATEQRLSQGPVLSRLTELQITGLFPLPTNDPNTAADEQAIINAGLNERSALLHDAAYLASFSNDGVMLTGTERAALENGVRAQMKSARLAAAASAYANVQARYDALTGLYSDARIVGLIMPYLL